MVEVTMKKRFPVEPDGFPKVSPCITFALTCMVSLIPIIDVISESIQLRSAKAHTTPIYFR